MAEFLHELSEDTNDTITITGTHTWSDRSPYSLQTMRLIMNEARVPLNVIKEKLVRFNGTGETIATGVAIDGSLNDFTTMMTFTLPDNTDNQYLVFSGNLSNQLYVYHLEGAPVEELKIRIGQNVFDMPPVDTSLDVHAMVAIYDHTTQEVIGAVDGEALASFGTVTFDGATGEIVFGASSTEHFTGFLGEGILSAAKGTETDWQEFWTRVKDTVVPARCPAMGLQLFDNSDFACGTDRWGSNEEFYPATITDNGDGSIHLKSDTDYGSVIPYNRVHPDDSYTLTIVVRNMAGNGKASIRNTGGTWNSVTLVDGTNTIPYTGDVDTINIGADNDASFECDFDFIGMVLT